MTFNTLWRNVSQIYIIALVHMFIYMAPIHMQNQYEIVNINIAKREEKVKGQYVVPYQLTTSA